MPSAYVEKLASEHGVSVSEAEKKWDAAKKAAREQGMGERYGYVTNIFKKMMHEASVRSSLVTIQSRLKATRG